MPYQYTTISDNDFGNGINQSCTEDRITEGFVEEAINVTVDPDGFISKRPGYELYSGQVPLKVHSYYSTASKLIATLSLDTDILNLPTRAVVLRGEVKGSTQEFPEGSTTTRYYPIASKRAYFICAGGGATTIINLAADLTNITSENCIIGIQIADGTASAGELLEVNMISIDKSTHQITVVLINNNADAVNVTVSWVQRDTDPGSTYIYSGSLSNSTSLQTKTISAGTHALGIHPFVIKWYEDTGTAFVEIRAESQTVASTGDIVTTFYNNRNASVNIVGIICVPDKVNEGSISALSTTDLTLTDLLSDYISIAPYIKASVDLEGIVYNTCIIDYTANSVDVNFINGVNTDYNLQIGILYTNTVANILEIFPSITGEVLGSEASPITDSSLYLYGISPMEAYGEDAAFINHLDHYSNNTDDRIICGFDGDLFATYSGLELNAVDMTPNITGVVASSQVIGPAFIDTAASTGQSAYYKFTGVSAGFARGTSISYNSGTGYMDYKIMTPGLSKVGDRIVADLDFITVQNTKHSRNAGTFQIKAISVAGDNSYITISILNPTVTTTDYDEANAGFLAGVLSCTLVLNSSGATNFIVGDEVTSTFFDDLFYEVLYSKTVNLVIGGIVSESRTATGASVYGKRVSAVQRFTGVNCVKGDIISVGNSTTSFKVKSVIPDSVSITPVCTQIVDDGTNRIVTLDISSSNMNTGYLAIGQKILITDAGAKSGCVTIVSINNLSEFEIESEGISETISTPTILTGVLELDSDATVVHTFLNTDYVASIVSRWINIVHPYSSFDRDIQYISPYIQNSIETLRSVKASNCLYFLNSEDRLVKYDGTYITRAGLPTWQLTGFSANDSDMVGLSSAAVGEFRQSGTVSGDVNSGLITTTTLKDINMFKVGDQFTFSATPTVTRTIQSINSTVSPYSVSYEPAESDAVSSETMVSYGVIRYYARLELTDRQGNVIIGASYGQADLAIHMTKLSPNKVVKFIMPPVDTYRDYERIDVVIFRTKVNQLSYYEVGRLEVPFDTYKSYLLFNDTSRDEDLINEMLDISVSFFGNEAPVSLSEPLRAKCITALDNTVILGNITGNPRIDIRIDTRGESMECQRFFIKKDNTDTSGISDIENRQGFIVTTNSISPTGNPTIAVDSANYGDLLTINLPVTSSPLVEDDWIYISEVTTQSYPELWGWHQLINGTDGSNLKIKIPRPNLTYTINTSNEGNLKIYHCHNQVVIAAASVDTSLNKFTATHHFAVGQAVRVTTSDTLPLPLQINTDYYVTVASGSSLATGSFYLATSYTNALAGTIIDITSQGVGNHTFTPNTNDIPIVDGTTLNDFTNVSNKLHLPPTDFLVMERLSKAINAMQANTHTAGFTQWVKAFAGNSYKVGQIILESEIDTIEIDLPAISSFTLMYGNGIKRSSRESVGAEIKLMPSRLLVSYPNYPEVFDLPYGSKDTSDSVIDVNPTDGEEIIAIIPSFGSSTFTAAQKERALIVFKRSAIYLVNLDTKGIQKLETSNVGCISTLSPSTCRTGVAFMHKSGIYRLNDDRNLQHIGINLGRYLFANSDLRQAYRFVGHHNSVQKQYMITTVDSENNYNTMVYNFDRETTIGSIQETNKLGGWFTWTNIKAVMWCNDKYDSYFATNDGAVYRIRNSGTVLDYRDDEDPISSVLTLRSMDFGESTIRKVLKSMTLHFRNYSNATDTIVYSAINLSNDFTQLDTFKQVNLDNDSNLNDSNGNKISTLRFVIPNRKFTQLQVKLTNSELNSTFTLTGIDYRVGGLNVAGTLEAKDTIA